MHRLGHLTIACCMAVSLVDARQSIPIAMFFRADETNLQNVVKFFGQRQRSAAAFDLEISLQEDRTQPDETLALWQQVCERLKDGAVTMVSGAVDERLAAYGSLSNALDLPLVNWRAPLDDAASPMQLFTRPPAARLVADVIWQKHWRSFTYVHDGPGADLFLRQLYRELAKKNREEKSARLIQNEMVGLPKSTRHFDEFLDRFHRERFNDYSRNAFHVILDASTAERQSLLLKKLHQNTLKTQRFHYVVANFDLTARELERFSRGVVNVTGFQLANHERPFAKDYSDWLRRSGVNAEGQLTADEAIVHDSLLVISRAVQLALDEDGEYFDDVLSDGKFSNNGFPGLYCWPSQDFRNKNRPFSKFQLGNDFARHLQRVVLSADDGTLTGPISFDENGIRRNFEVAVHDLLFKFKSAQGAHIVHRWTESKGLATMKTVTNISTTGPTIAPVESLIVTTVETRPFLFFKRDAAKLSGNERFQGYAVDLMKLLAKQMGAASYELRLVADRQYGGVKPDGSWNGMIGELLHGSAHMAVAPLTINRARQRVVDFSKPFMTTGISIMIKKPEKQKFSVFSFMQPLSPEIWLYIIIAYVGVSIVIFVVSRFSPYEWRVEEMASGGGFTISNDFSIFNCLWFTLAAFMQQGTDIQPRSVAGRLASSAWWFFTMIMVSSYTANLAAFLTLEKMQTPINSVEDLAKQTKIQYGIQQGGSTQTFFESSTVPTYKKMWQYMSSQVPTVFTDSYARGIQRVRDSKGTYAFLLEETANEYANTRKPCDTMKVGSKLNSVGYGIATPFGSDLKEKINLAILELQEHGELKKIENRWWYDRGQCEQGMADSQSASLNLSKVAGIFYILIGGMLAAMLAALGEFIYRSRVENRTGRVTSLLGMFTRSLGTSMRSQLVALRHDRRPADIPPESNQ